jgi:hypothetical protein
MTRGRGVSATTTGTSNPGPFFGWFVDFSTRGIGPRPGPFPPTCGGAVGP